MALIVALVVARRTGRPGPAWARRPAGQRDPAGRGVRGAARADPRAHTRSRPQPRREAAWQDVLLPPLPAGKLAAHVVGYSTISRSRAGLEKSLNGTSPGRSAASTSSSSSSTTSAASRSSATRSSRRSTPRAARRARAAGPDLRRGRGARPAQREAARDGVAELRPEPRREPLRRDRGSPPTAGRRRRSSTAPRRALPPGSTFKVVTLAAAPSRYEPDSTFDPGLLHRLRQAGQQLRHVAPFGNLDLATALQYSVNSVFCNIGKALGAKRILDQAKKFGFYERPPLETPDGERYPSGLYRRGEPGTRSATGRRRGRMAFGQSGCS